MERKLKVIVSVLVGCLIGANGIAETELPVSAIHFESFKTLPIQHGGRLKPLDTFAREVVQTVTGKTTFKKRQAIEVIFSWMAYPDVWSKLPCVLLTSHDIKAKYGFAKERKYFTPTELIQNQGLLQAFREIRQKRQRDEKLSPFEDKVETVESQLIVLERVSTGDFLTIIPHPGGGEKDWFPITGIEAAVAVYNDFDANVKLEEIPVTLQGVLASYKTNDLKIYALTSSKLKQLLSELPKVKGYPFSATLSLEKLYNEFRPFQMAWILYVIAAIFLLLYFLTQKKVGWYMAGLATSLGAFGVQIFGFALRIIISGRAPVGNMYESIIWVSLGVVIFAYILLYTYKNPAILTAATVVAAVGLVLADNLPMVFDPSIRPLAPVLRSNFWLTVHVLTITLSYAAFALGMGLGNWVLLRCMTRSYDPKLRKQHVQFIYRSLQIGVLLLAAGTILGGVWADYSWGRFWGWDPKEVWALIVLLLYLAVIHGRYAGWLRDFGTAAGAVLAFQGVLMAWYGVNFVLGVGLHSYGFGSGGLSYVLGYVTLQLLLIFFSWYRYQAIESR